MMNYHDSHFSFDPSRDIVWREIAGYILKVVKKPRSVLDIAAGYCNFINNCDARGKTAIDIWKDFPRYCRRDITCHIYDVRKGLTKILKRKFDLIMVSNLLEHLTQEEALALLKDCRDYLNPDGYLVVMQPNFAISYRKYFDDYTHKTVYTDVSLTAILKNCGYEIARSEKAFLPLTVKSRFPKWGFLVRFYLSMPFRPFAGQMLIIARKKR